MLCDIIYLNFLLDLSCGRPGESMTRFNFHYPHGRLQDGTVFSLLMIRFGYLGIYSICYYHNMRIPHATGES